MHPTLMWNFIYIYLRCENVFSFRLLFCLCPLFLFVVLFVRNVPKFCSLMNMASKSKNGKLAKFISGIFELF